MCKSVWHQKWSLGIIIPKGKKSKESLKTSVPELRSRCSRLGYFVVFCSSGKEAMNIHSLSCTTSSVIYIIYTICIYIIYICVHISSIWNRVVSCNTLTRNQTYSLDHSWCNFSIKSFIIQWFSVAQCESSMTGILISLFFQSSSHLLPDTLFQPPSSYSSSTRCSMMRPYFCQLLKIVLCCWHRENKLHCPLPYSIAAVSHQSKNCCFYDELENLIWSWWRRHTHYFLDV